MSNFCPIDRQTSFLLPPSVDDWLPQKHLARFVVELIDGLDISAMSGVEVIGARAASSRINASWRAAFPMAPSRLENSSIYIVG